ncbi:2'-5' RNA ligase family protein [Sphingomonas immobilis]|uniref:2'-5' RNA ligase family protein n=1 Tax=Sphingomonas immobilis TaxID=3063997 RepID=A0ABT9A383_9SPHN|nr:2'-5' RNA ligase family protein [Sphingomonas sp. CA1-15]MDO7844304.1 2'-5' RNA ligase family protein [Sphingomonas sp. CA1-15]
MSAAPIIVTALFGPVDQAWFDGLRKKYFPPERNYLDAHLTMFHHLAPSLEAELKQRLSAATRGVKAPVAHAAGLLSLGEGTAYRIESEGLEQIRAELAEAFAPMLLPQDRAGWRPHVTIQNKVKPTEAKALLKRLEGSFQRKPVAVAGLASWYYRGGPWEPLSQHAFG